MKHKRWLQLSIFSFVLVVVGYTLAGSLFGSDDAPPEVGDPAPDFRLETLAGDAVGPSHYRGGPVIINFWGTFCPPCVEETPALQRMYEKYKDQGVVMLGVNLGEPLVSVEQFTERFGVTYPVLLDPDLVVRDRYGVKYYPTTFFVDREGIVREVKIGGMTEGFIEEKILQLLR